MCQLKIYFKALYKFMHFLFRLRTALVEVLQKRVLVEPQYRVLTERMLLHSIQVSHRNQSTHRKIGLGSNISAPRSKVLLESLHEDPQHLAPH